MKTAWLLAKVLALAAMLTGCASGPLLVTSDVQTFSSIATTTPLVTPATYRFERLPSQQASQASGQQQLEQLAEPALAKVGLVRDDVNGLYNVQVTATLKSVVFGPDLYGYPYWGGPRVAMYYGRGGWWPGYGYGYGYGPRWGMGASWAYTDSYPSDAQRDVSIVMREANSGKVVYETRATHYGTYEAYVAGDGTVLSLMFEAALSGFPQPPQGVRRVTVAPPQPAQPVQPTQTPLPNSPAPAPTATPTPPATAP